MRPEIVQPSRRGLILGLGASLITAPAIVRAASLMPIRAGLVLPISDGIALRSATHPVTFTVSGYDMLGNLVTEEIEFIKKNPTGLGIRYIDTVTY